MVYHTFRPCPVAARHGASRLNLYETAHHRARLHFRAIPSLTSFQERRQTVPISFSIEPSTGLLRTVVTGRFSRDDAVFYATELRAHPELARVERRLVDVRPSAVMTADEILDLLLIEHDMAGSVRRTDRRAILLNSENGPALGRELVVSDRRHSGIPVAYRVFRSSAHAYRYLRVDPRLTSDRLRNAGRA